NVAFAKLLALRQNLAIFSQAITCSNGFHEQTSVLTNQPTMLTRNITIGQVDSVTGVTTNRNFVMDYRNDSRSTFFILYQELEHSEFLNVTSTRPKSLAHGFHLFNLFVR